MSKELNVEQLQDSLYGIYGVISKLTDDKRLIEYVHSKLDLIADLIEAFIDVIEAKENKQ